MEIHSNPPILYYGFNTFISIANVKLHFFKPWAHLIHITANSGTQTLKIRHIPLGVKLNRGGSSLPLGSFVFGSRSSLKNACAHASRGLILDFGVYSSSLLHSWIASGGVLGRNTWMVKNKGTVIHQDYEENHYIDW